MGRRAWLIVVVVLCLGGAACTRPTDGYCCTSADLCADVGGEVQQCPSGQLCDDDGSLASGPAHTCVADPAAEPCTGPQDCDAPTPACVDEICVECDDDEHCNTALEPVCDLGLHLCGECTENGQCDRFGGVCGPEGNCVECTPAATPLESGDCPGERPVCEVNGACRECEDHRECDSGACDLATGACVAAAEIAYVDAAAAAANTTCTDTSKCNTITKGLQAGGGARRYVVIAGGNYIEDVTISGRTVTLIGYGAQLVAASNGVAAVSVGGAGGTVEVVGMELFDSTSGVDCTGSSVASTAVVVLTEVLVRTHTAYGASAYRCDLVMRRSRVTDAVQGGVLLNQAGFDITNSVIDNNGGDGLFGGISISMPRPAPQRIAFNTIVDNEVNAGTIAGIDCTSLTAIPAFRNNLITGNEGTLGQVSGMPMCSYEYSLINPEVDGTGNLSGDPDFVGGEYRIGADSDAIDVAADNSGATRIDDDIDGEDRPMTAADIGADEFHPPP
jgi:hypothetical protein